MDEVQSKPIWKSKTFQSDVFTIVLAIMQFSDMYFHTAFTTSHWYAIGLSLAGMLGIYGRKTADSKIEGLI